MNGRFVVVDLETTGNTIKKGDRIIQIGIVVIENGEVVKRFSTFVNPERDIPPFIQQLTGIEKTVVSQAPAFQDVAPIIAEQLQGSYFVAHNVHFDWAFLQAELLRAGFAPPSCSVIDTVELARLLMPTQSSYKLADLSHILSFAHDRPHQADHDAEATASLLLFLLRKLAALPLVTLKHLRRHSKPLKSDIALLLDELITKKECSLPQYDDSMIEYEGIAIKKWDEPRVETDRVDIPSFLQWLKTSSFPKWYEKRAEQIKMMEDVDCALATCQHALIEAGTGMGKTLAYLLPALFYAVTRKQQVVISTHTIQLQRQLLEKEMLNAAQLVPFSFRVALLKGRRNYISVRKFAKTLQKVEYNYDVALTKCQLLVWLTETETGDIDELNLTAGGTLFWENIHSDGSHDEQDFFTKAKKRANDADVIVTNHAFLLYDLTANEQSLPYHRVLIVDEAHHLEDVAAHFFGCQISYEYMRSLLMRMNDMAVSSRHDRLRSLLADIEYEMSELFQWLRRYVNRHQTEEGRVRYRFVPCKEKGKEWGQAREWLMRLLHYSRQLQQMIQQIADVDKKPFEQFIDSLTTLHHLFVSDDDEIVRWIEVDMKAPIYSLTVHSQPLDLSTFFADQLFAKKQSVILTSATLTANRSFSFIVARLGLDDFYPLTRSLPSPFRYEEQAILMVPSDVPTLPSATLEEYAHATAQQLVQIARRTKKRMLVLFTSYELLKMTYDFVKNMNDDDSLVLIGQGVNSGNAAKLTRHFQQFEHAMLFGTSTFWEGIDLPGHDVSSVAIVRLPFAPPDDPVMEAKSEHIRKKGGNPFYDLCLPHAILRFKQGVGRLIRTKNDRGVVFVFDQRLLTASYGKYFLQSIPSVRVIHAPLRELLPQLDCWL